MDVYLFPAVVGGGLGDIEEVLAAGRHLQRVGHRVQLFRRRDRPLPRGVEGPWEWPKDLERTSVLRPRSRSALTVSPSWGISAAPDATGPLGRGGPWQEEARSVERAYGTGRTVHVSLEEFARTFPSRREVMERWREGGRPLRWVRAHLRSPGSSEEVTRWKSAFRTFRHFARPNVLHLYATFRPNPTFASEFPEAVQCGPLWPRRGLRWRPQHRSGRASWVWYASPASAETLLAPTLEGLASSPRRPFLWVRSPRSWRSAVPPGQGRLVTSVEPSSSWSRRFSEADVRIVTGSRTLLEAIELGGPFLYFNGTLGRGGARRRHRPDKIEALLQAMRAEEADPELLRDLRDFSRGHRVCATVQHAARREGAWARFPKGPWVGGFRSPYDDLGKLLVATARSLGEGESSLDLVARVRTRVLTGTLGRS